MNSAYQELIKEAFALAPSNSVVYETLEILQEGVQDPIYIVRARESITVLDENGIQKTFEPVGFQLTLPPSNEEGFPSLNIGVDNINRRISDFVNLAKSEVVPVQVIYRPYVSTDLARPQMIPPTLLYLKDVAMTTFQATGKATFMDVVNAKFPSELYTRGRFPSLA